MSHRRTTSPGSLWSVLVFPVVIVALGLAIDHFDAFQNIRGYVSQRTIPETLIRSGRTGRELRLLDYRSLVGLRLEGFDNTLRPEEMPSTTILEHTAQQVGLPILSVVVAPNDLLNRDTGLVANYNKRGRNWERPAYASYFRDHELVFATGAGLRVHGGKSRWMTAKSFRLHFRELYGAPSVQRNLVFDGADNPLHSLVIHNDIRTRQIGGANTDWHFVNPIAYEVAERIGCITPATQPVQFYLNGIYQGPYVLKEQITPDFLVTHFGHKDFVLADTKSDDGKSTLKLGSERELRELLEWLREAPAPLTMTEVEEKVDLTNLTNWFISILYSGTTDPYQGKVARDRSKAESRWFWINWDMDHSFMDWYGQAPQPWEIDTFTGRLGVVTKWRRRFQAALNNHPRSIIFNRLRAESSEYREYFLSRLVEVLNHELTPEFMDELIGRYEDIAETFGIEDLTFLETLRNHAEHRPAVLKAQMNTYFSSGPSFSLSVEGAESLGIKVDGRSIRGRYSGWYFADTPAQIAIGNQAEAERATWVINGALLASAAPSIELNLASDTTIEVVLGD